MHGIPPAALVAVCLLATPAFAEELAGPFVADVVRVIDGDTFQARVHIWLGQELVTAVRLRGIDAPELRGACDSERVAAVAARDHLAALLGSGPVQVSAISRDKYGGRVDAAVRLPSGEDAAAAMLSAGHVQPSQRGHRDPWCPP
ncbi:MAG: thermonuclease family protein [Alphaproteobacteria bacterium]